MLLGMAGLCAVSLAWLYGAGGLPDSDGGVLFPSFFGLFGPLASFVASCGAMVSVAVLMALINRTFNLLRTSSLLLAGLYLFMQGAVPEISVRLSSGTVLTLFVLVETSLLYSCYQRQDCTQTVFLAFFLCSLASLAEASSLIYLPVLFIGCMQMRCFTLRSVTAALLGIVTPFWIITGFVPGLAGGFRLPSIAPGWPLHMGAHSLPLAVTVGVMLLWCSVMLIQNLYRVYSYNARARSLNGLMATMTVATIALAVADFANVGSYLSPLLCFTALQTAMFFRINYERRGYIWVLSLLTASAALYIWNLWT